MNSGAISKLRVIAVALLAGLLAACGGGGGTPAAAVSTGTGTGAGTGTGTSTGIGTGSTSGGTASGNAGAGSSTASGGTVAIATGIWSGTLTPDDPAQAPATGWLVINADGTFRLDTDAAQFNGSATTQGQALTAAATAKSYTAQFADGSSISLNGNFADNRDLAGTYSSDGGSGTVQFHFETALSTQKADLAAAAGTYHGQLWIKDSALTADVAIDAGGALSASTSGGCKVTGTVHVGDAEHNGYTWSGQVAGCGNDGAASGTGFLVGNYFMYLSGSVQGRGLWMGGSDSDAPSDQGS